LFLRTREYRLPSVEVSEHLRITIRGLGQGVAAQRGGLIFMNEGDGLWRRFDLRRPCLSEQEVESQDKTRRERDHLIDGRT
jgi:hypothetical protein